MIETNEAQVPPLMSTLGGMHPIGDPLGERSVTMAPPLFDALKATFSRTEWRVVKPAELGLRLGIARALVPAALSRLVTAGLLRQQGIGRRAQWRLAERWDWSRLGTEAVGAGAGATPAEGEPLPGDDHANRSETRLSLGPDSMSGRRFQGSPFAPPPPDATPWPARQFDAANNAKVRTPTRYDLARWLFQLIAEIEGGVTSRLQCLELMSEVMLVVQPVPEERQPPGDAPETANSAEDIAGA